MKNFETVEINFDDQGLQDLFCEICENEGFPFIRKNNLVKIEVTPVRLAYLTGLIENF